MKQYSSKMKKCYIPLIGAALAVASLFHFSLPAFAAGTSAGTTLRNSASASYDDQDNNRYNVTSNEVTVTVGKIAGITNVPRGFTDNTSSATNTSILTGDSVSFNFEVRNTGNDATDIFIPAASNIAVENLINVTVTYFEADGTTAIANTRVTSATGGERIANVPENTSIIVRVTGTVSATATQGDNISVQLGNTGNNDNDTDSQNQLDIDSSVVNDVQERDVRTLTADASNTVVDTEPVNGQREASAKQTTSVGSQSLALARIEKVNAGITDGGTQSNLSDKIITYNLDLDVAENSDDQVQNVYGSSFTFNAAALEGRDYSGATASGAAGTPADFTFSGANAGLNTLANRSNLILISDAIPEYTTLDTSSGSVTAPTAGATANNWIPVYTTSPLTTPADEAAWTDDASTLTASDITRVGWVYDARTTANGGNDAIAAGDPVTGFSFKVITNGLNNTAQAIYNISQVFGSTDDNVDNAAGGLTIYDESGDQNPANLNDDGSFPTVDETTPTSVDEVTGGKSLDGNGTVDTGVNVFGYDNDVPANNQDTNNNNQGAGTAGEYNTITVAPDAVASDLANGPVVELNGTTEERPEATGDIFGVTPADDNHDFQNKAAASPTSSNPLAAPTGTPPTPTAGYDNSVYDPAPVTFTNVVRNPISGTTIDEIVLRPVNPNDVAPNLTGTDAIDLDPNDSVTATDLPNGTTVTITYGSQTATYNYTISGTGASATGAFAFASGTTADVKIGAIAQLSNETYTVAIDLPAGTPLSTNFIDGITSNDLVGGFPVMILAFDDEAGGTDDELDTSENYNVTVNQIYTGYLQLVKESRVLRDSVEISAFGTSGQQPAPGDIIEYRITYTNISEAAPASSGSVALNADDVVIVEDGTTADDNDNGTLEGTEIDGNNWALDNDVRVDGGSNVANPDGDDLIDTLHVRNSAVDTTTGSEIDYFRANGTSETSDSAFSEVNSLGVTDDITKYEVSGITSLTPGSSGVFRFQRKITSPEDIENLTP